MVRREVLMSDGHDLVLTIESVSHRYGSNRVLHEIDLAIGRGEIVGLVGPSGCGKSTLLNTVIGTLIPTEGGVFVHPGSSNDGQPENLGPQRVTGPSRDRGIVYQRYALFPHLTAQDNVALGLILDETSFPFRLFRRLAYRKLRREYRERAAAWLERLGLGDAVGRYPDELSGGMRQRVAIAQALIMKPKLLMLDEPFGALDEATREDLQRMLITLYHENHAAIAAGEEPGASILMVTHELTEALYVGDRVLGLSQHWNWRDAGHSSCPGARIVYDRPAPVYTPDQVRNAEDFVAQREEIRRVVFTPEATATIGLDEYITFWDERAGAKS